MTRAGWYLYCFFGICITVGSCSAVLGGTGNAGMGTIIFLVVNGLYWGCGLLKIYCGGKQEQAEKAVARTELLNHTLQVEKTIDNLVDRFYTPIKNQYFDSEATTTIVHQCVVLLREEKICTVHDNELILLTSPAEARKNIKREYLEYSSKPLNSSLPQYHSCYKLQRIPVDNIIHFQPGAVGFYDDSPYHSGSMVELHYRKPSEDNEKGSYEIMFFTELSYRPLTQIIPEKEYSYVMAHRRRFD